MKRKPDIVIIITAIMFGVALAVMIAALVCMAADIYIWHELIPTAILLTVVTGLMFGVSVALHIYNVKAAKNDLTVQDRSTHKPDKRGLIARAFGVVSLVCFYIPMVSNVVLSLCDGLWCAIINLFSTLAALASLVFAIISVVLSKRSKAEKLSSFFLLSIPLAFVIVCIVFMAIVVGIMFYLMLISWAQWGLI